MLQQISTHTGLDQFADVFVFFVRREDEYLRLGTALHDLARGFDAVEKRHGDVQQHDVGSQFFRHLHGFASMFGFANHFNIALCFEEKPKAFPHHRVVVNQQDFYTHIEVFPRAVKRRPAIGHIRASWY